MKESRLPYFKNKRKYKHLVLAFLCFFSLQSIGQKQSSDPTIRSKKNTISSSDVESPNQNLSAHKLFIIAKNTPDSIGTKTSKITEYFKSKTDNPRELVSLFVYWIAQNIAYDVEKYQSNDNTYTNVAETLETKKTMCQGYSELLWELCAWAEIGSEIVIGYAKGFDYNGKPFLETNHLWNVVEIDNKWELVDATWASGTLSYKKNGLLVFNKTFRKKYVFAKPDFLISTHFPIDSEWQLLDNPISLEDFYAKKLD